MWILQIDVSGLFWKHDHLIKIRYNVIVHMETTETCVLFGPDYKYGFRGKQIHNYCKITGFDYRVTRRVPIVEKELLTLPEHQNSRTHPGFCRVRVTMFVCLFGIFKFLLTKLTSFTRKCWLLFMFTIFIRIIQCCMFKASKFFLWRRMRSLGFHMGK